MPPLAALVLVAGNAAAGVTLGVSATMDAIPTLDNSYGVLELAYNLGKAAPAGNITQDGIAFEGKSHANGAVAPVYGTANGITIQGRADDDGSTPGNFAMKTADLGNDLWHTHSFTSKGGSMLLDITGLDTARNYQVQLLFGEPRTQNSALYNAGTVTATDAASQTASSALTFGHGAGDHAVVTIEVRDSTTLTFRMENNGGLNPAIAGVVLHSMPDPTEDSDSDGMYDAWEIIHFGNLSHDGTADSDGDSLSDVFEFEAGLNPNDADSDDDGAADPIGIAGYLSVEKWDNIAGATLADLTTSQAFYGQPSERYFTPRAKAITGTGDSYGLRMRGTIIAPHTGPYRFWIAGDDDCELLLSADARRFNKASIASVSGWTNEEQWDKYPGQQSQPVELVAGQSYYIEVLQKEYAGGDHVAVAWEYSGQARQVIPGANLRSLVPDPDDADDDGMLDSWERQVGLDPGDNGANLTYQRAYADIDGDGIPNWKEFASGGNPFDGWQAPASAVSLSVSAPTDAIPTLDNSYGTLELAYNFGKASPEGDITQDGIPFEGKTHPNGAVCPVYGTTHGITVRGSADDDGNRAGNFNMNTADLGNDLWHTISYTDKVGSMLLDVTGLDPAKDYQIQILFGDPRTNYWAYYNNGTISAATDMNADSVSAPLSFGLGYGTHAVATLNVTGSSSLVFRMENDSRVGPEIAGIVIHSKSTPPGPTVDYDSDGMADAWEITHFGNLNHDGSADSDGDTLNDLMEFETGLDPKDPDSDNDGKADWIGIPGYLSVEKWDNIAGSSLTGLTLSQAIYNTPSESYYTPRAKSVSPAGDSYGLRMRGTVIAPRTGQYRFWIAGDDQCELFLSTDSGKFNKRLLATADSTGENQWFAAPSQQSERVELIAGQEYYIEILLKQSVDADHVAVAWEDNGLRQVIPGSQLRSYVPDPLDLDDDGLPDAWEIQVGLDATTAANNQGGYGDADGDGFDNSLEYKLGANPLQPGGIPGCLTREVWLGVPGNDVDDLTGSDRFFQQPDLVSLIQSGEAPADFADSYGQRIRGTIIAPVTGNYRFWIAGDVDYELWLSSDSGKFRKRKLAGAYGVDPDEWGVDPHQWDLYPSQRSANIQLIAGQRYFIEILHKQGASEDHVAVAWQYTDAATGLTTARHIIPSASLVSDIPNPDDADNDCLPDSWETAMGLSATDNGLTDRAREGEYGDYDGDLLGNREEWLLGTDPTKVDSDGDGVSDYAEIHTYGSNPLVVDTLHQLVRDFNLAAHTGTATGDWVVNAEGSIYSSVRRGSISYTFDVTTAGVHALELGGRAIGTSLGPVEEMPLRITIDGISLGSHILRSENGGAGLLKILTPWLAVGQHQITILSDNILASRSLQIDSLELFLVMGVVSISDLGTFWLPTRLQQENAVTVCPQESMVSPVCIEGRARFFEQLAITGDGLSVTPMKALGSGWYANVPLAENAPTAIDLTFENGNLAAPQTVTWVETDVINHETLTIRKGDSLRLTGRGDLESGLDLFDVTININNGGTVYQFTADESAPYRFDTAGIYQIHCGVFENNDPIAANTLTVNVVDADFGGPFDVLAGSPREWTLPAVGPEIHIQPDPLMACTELAAPAAGGRLLRVDPLAAAERRLLARTGVGGPIIETGVVRGYQTYRTDATGDTRVIQTFPNGDQIVMMSIVAPELPPGGYIRLVIFVGGVTFLDGTTEKIITAADLDANGLVYVKFNFPEGTYTSICHHLYLHEASGTLIGKQ